MQSTELATAPNVLVDAVLIRAKTLYHYREYLAVRVCISEALTLLVCMTFENVKLREILDISEYLLSYLQWLVTRA